MGITHESVIYASITALVWLLMLLLAIFGGKAITLKVLAWAKVPALPQRVPVGTDSGTLLSSAEKDRTVLRGGLWIGFLERIAVTACVMAGQPALISLILGVKGLGRYPELRDNPEASERFLIGTGASILSAVTCGILGHVTLPVVLTLFFA